MSDDELIDRSQNTDAPAGGLRPTPETEARHLIQISRGLDEWSSVSFRRHMRRPTPPDRDSVYVDAYVEDHTRSGRLKRRRMVSGSTDIEWASDTEARWLIPVELTQDPHVIEVQWHWTTNGTDRSWSLFYDCSVYMPSYADLSEEERDLAMACMNRFSLLHDNTYGNGMPNLSEEWQTDFSLEDIAQCMNIAVQRINSSAIQPTSYIIGDGRGQHFPVTFYNLLMTATLMEVVHRLMLGYLEQPSIVGSTGIAYADRRDYYQKWRQEYDLLKSDYDTLLPIYSRQTLNLVASSVLVAGGLYGPGTAGGGRMGGNGWLTNSAITAAQRGWAINMFQPISVASINANR